MRVLSALTNHAGLTGLTINAICNLVWAGKKVPHRKEDMVRSSKRRILNTSLFNTAADMHRHAAGYIFRIAFGVLGFTSA